MRLVPAKVGDAAAMALVHARAFDPPWSEADFADLLAAPGGFGLLAVDAAEAPKGLVLARAIAGEAEILTLAVDPDRRREGLAWALLTGALAVAAASGAGEMFLEVAADNPAAIGLYAKAGFEPRGRRRGYYSRGDKTSVDALVLRLQLTPPP